MEEAYQFLLKEIKKDKKPIIAGISGGPDSMALLHLLIRLRNEINVIIVCAHVNHNVRVESEEEAVNLRKYCADNNVPFEMMKIESYGGDNFENEARAKRYVFFEELIKKHEAGYLVTAHHGDDLMETILMRMVRGSTFKGYAGFSRIVNRDFYKILRPLVVTTKSEIINYNKANNLDYALDITNEQDIHTRNRYRKYVLPFLKEEDSNVHQKFLKFSQTILEYNEYIDIETNKKIEEVYNNKKLDIRKFLKFNKVMQDRIINRIMETIYLDDLMLINDTHTALIFKLINSKRPNSYLYFPNNIRIVKSYHTLAFMKKEEELADYEFEIVSNVNLPNGRNINFSEDCEDKSNYICRLDSNEIALPLYVRNKREGDRIDMKGMYGRKKIKDIFINEKISARDRKTWPILVDKEGKIVWLPGLKKSKYDKSKNESYDIIIRYY